MPVVPVLGEPKMEDSSEFKASLSRHLLCMLTQQGRCAWLYKVVLAFEMRVAETNRPGLKN